MATFVFFPEGAYGPTNNCVGIGDVLLRRGHRVVFVVEESFAGTLEAKGFEERLMRLGPTPEVEEAPGQFWKDFIRETAPVFRKPTIEQLEDFIEPTWQALLRRRALRRRAARGDLRRGAAGRHLRGQRPLLPGHPRERPAVGAHPLLQPARGEGPDLPPTFSGYPVADRSGWDAFRAEYRRTHGEMHASFDEFVQERGAPPLPELEFIHESPWLNLYALSRRGRLRALAAARADVAPPGVERARHRRRVRAARRARPPARQLVYLSLGSLGSADVDLMERLVESLAESPHRFIVSKGPQHDLYELADNMWGAEFLPQPSILPQVDLVITHGGNNTTTECFHFGKPMIVLPLFWDQYDNAQRVDETGFGVRLPTYAFERRRPGGRGRPPAGRHGAAQPHGADRERLQANPGTERAADLSNGSRRPASRSRPNPLSARSRRRGPARRSGRRRPRSRATRAAPRPRSRRSAGRRRRAGWLRRRSAARPRCRRGA